MRSVGFTIVAIAVAAIGTSGTTHAQAISLGRIASFTITGAAIKAPLDGLKGDATRGRTPHRGTGGDSVGPCTS